MEAAYNAETLRVYTLTILLTLLGQEGSAETAIARAQELLAQGDYPAAERQLEQVLTGLPEGERDARALVMAKIAETRALQGIIAGSTASIREALALSRAPQIRQSAIMVYLRARRFSDLREHAEALLRIYPQEPNLRFARGLALAKTGELERAVEDLRAAATVPNGGRDAQFELALCLAKLGRPRQALAPLRAILAVDPHDAEACYQASRQLILLGGEDNARLASLLMRYFEALRAAAGSSSRAEHLAFAGKAVEAALERAARWERLGAIEQAVREAQSVLHLPRGDAAREWLERYMARLGLTVKLEVRPLEELLAAAEAGSDRAPAQRVGKLLLAVHPNSIVALRRLVIETQDPSLIVPRWHYLNRLAVAVPDDASVLDNLVKLRASLGDSVPAR